MVIVGVALGLSALVIAAGIVYAIWSQSQAPPDLDFVGPLVATLFGGVALAAIWLSVLIGLVIRKAVRVIRDSDRSSSGR